ncbi:thymidylate flavin-dependent : Thymidylate synthase ThyX OS=Rubellimicrobium thermophilum DSM 16684 GN=thyX PE=3 SV=1: Thy1 [Gemmataceae bacterium]|nr:thymidylate flavin-dependent : Thymidylate synthase ThyX OS=Rubellimicrobium thermophilum DSM 16684 GN=thyX PE=3 SV=1: Thy1 [Gemmataceae bacterium]VTT98913.1 thymidylate flavin-dependent : Thymidylate synthase ThyX OS=Rubellimicrobium thermophilum DSM 16684 GN=thyX PE=3 SV=1: Thy1 [Gemmataceae bacterium]
MEAIKVLDHGYVRLVECWGHGDAGRPEDRLTDDFECGIIEAARQSTQGSFRGWDQDEKLLRFLFCNRPPHATPFEFAGMVIEVQAPIFVFREWHRHRTQSYNEMSARYAPLPDLNYVPTVERCLMVSATNRQAGAVNGSDQIDEAAARRFREDLRSHYERTEAMYQISLACGLPKELARVCLPVGRYSRMRASTSLRNWLAFLTLRSDPGAQWEIRQFADAVGTVVAARFPRTWSLFAEGKGA